MINNELRMELMNRRRVDRRRREIFIGSYNFKYTKRILDEFRARLLTDFKEQYEEENYDHYVMFTKRNIRYETYQEHIDRDCGFYYSVTIEVYEKPKPQKQSSGEIKTTRGNRANNGVIDDAFSLGYFNTTSRSSSNREANNATYRDFAMNASQEYESQPQSPTPPQSSSHQESNRDENRGHPSENSYYLNRSNSRTLLLFIQLNEGIITNRSCTFRGYSVALPADTERIKQLIERVLANPRHSSHLEYTIKEVWEAHQHIGFSTHPSIARMKSTILDFRARATGLTRRGSMPTRTVVLDTLPQWDDIVPVGQYTLPTPSVNEVIRQLNETDEQFVQEFRSIRTSRPQPTSATSITAQTFRF